MTVHPPIGRQGHYSPLTLTVINAKERGTPQERDPIHWKLLTNLSVEDLSAAIEKLEWYAQRWKIETFHQVIKSGCRTEESKLRSADRLTNFIAVLFVIARRVLRLTMVNRADSEASGDIAFTDTELKILDHLAGSVEQETTRTIKDYLTEIAKLGDYLARGKDPPPGNMVLWRGLTRLTDIHLGFELKNQIVGNWRLLANRHRV